MPGIKEVASVVVGNREGEEARTSPYDVFGKGKFLNILPLINNYKENEPSCQEESTKA